MNGILKKVAALTPKIEAGAKSGNVNSIIDSVTGAAKNGAKIAVLPLNIILGDVGKGGPVPDICAKISDEALSGLLGLEICCVFAVDYGSFSPIIIENGQIHRTRTHTAANGARIYVASSTDENTEGIRADLIAVPCSYPAYMDGAARVLPQIADLSKRTGAVVVSASNGNGNTSYKFVRSADKIIAHNGTVYAFNQSDLTDCTTVLGDKSVDIPPPPVASWIPSDSDEVFDIVSRGIRSRMKSAKADKLVFGLSGGLDSTCTMIFAAATADKYGFSRKSILPVRMPSRESGTRTQSNAEKLIKLLGTGDLQIPIDADYRLKRISHAKADVVYENAQARERAAILLDLANKEGALVLGTSDLTEIALGFSTYGGDQLAHYNANAGLTKLAIRSLVGHYGQKYGGQIKECLDDILATPYSPELKPGQSSESILGPYKVFEFFLLRLLAHKEGKEAVLAAALKEFSEFTPAQLADYYTVFIKRFFFGRFKHNFSCDGIALTPFDLSLFDINCDINPEFLL